MAEPQKNITERVSVLETDVRGVRTDLHDLKESFDTFARDMRALHKTPWATMAAWAGVVLTIMMLAGAPFIRELTRIEDAIVKMGDVHAEHSDKGGHAPTETRVTALEGLVASHQQSNVAAAASLDAMLQREMRLLDSVQSKDVEILRWQMRAERLGWKGGNGDDQMGRSAYGDSK